MVSHYTRVLILGSGPAGCTAAIYTARANLEPIMIQGIQPGGQLIITTDVENYPGFAKAIQGPWLMDQMEKQARHVGTLVVQDHIQSVDLSKRPFQCKGYTDEYYGETLIVATGAQAKWLGLESETYFQGYGVSGCATCDGFFFKGKPVAVVGGGNTAVEEALYLTHHASHVTLIHRRDRLRAEPILQKRLLSHPNVSVLWNSVVEEIVGIQNPREVTGIRLRHTLEDTVQTLAVEGVFIAIGHTPNTALFQGQLEVDTEGYIHTTPGTTDTSVAGVFAAGDVQDKVYRQAVTAAGTGCMAALQAQKFLEGR